MKSFLNRFINTDNVHMDFASTTPVDGKVLKAMKPYWNKDFFNPSASYKEGQKVKKEIKNAKSSIATYLNVKENEIIFTQGGTESINLAIIGLIKKVLITKNSLENFIPHVIVSSIEHPAVNECIEQIKILGAEVDIIPVQTNGIIDIQAFEKLINERTVLVTVIGASNETGVIQPIHKISSIIKKYKNSQNRVASNFPFLHSDVSQLALTQDISFSKLGVDMLTIDGSKIYAPKMSGLLVKKNYIEIEPVIYGGGQEFGLRSGTESVPQMIGLKTAFDLVQHDREKLDKKFERNKKYFISQLEKNKINFEINGEGEIIPNILNICIKGLNSDFAVIQMDELGLNCAAMTSCAGSKGILKSEVLEAMGKSDCSGSSLRFSFGKSTTQSDIRKAVKVLSRVCEVQNTPLSDRGVN